MLWISTGSNCTWFKGHWANRGPARMQDFLNIPFVIICFSDKGHEGQLNWTELNFSMRQRSFKISFNCTALQSPATFGLWCLFIHLQPHSPNQKEEISLPFLQKNLLSAVTRHHQLHADQMSTEEEIAGFLDPTTGHKIQFWINSISSLKNCWENISVWWKCWNSNRRSCFEGLVWF